MTVNVYRPTKTFIQKHKTAITIVATATITTVACAALAHVGIQQHDEFLKEHDLYDTFYAMNED